MTEELEIIRKNIDETCSGLYLDSEMARLDYPFEKMMDLQDRYGDTFRRFVKNLYAQGITYKEVSEEWKYAGGDGRSQKNPNISPSDSQKAHQRYYYQTYGHNDYPKWEGNCVCGHIIYENCYIVPRRDIYENYLVIGNCCIKRFIPKSGRGRTCAKCGEAHRNSKVNLCNLCDPAKNKPKGRRGRPPKPIVY